MSNLQNSSGSNSEVHAPWEGRDIGDGFEAITDSQKLELRAKTIPIIEIMKRYRLQVSYENRKICCPFKNHKSGRESSGSFVVYPETNTFWCFGCKTGRTAIDFVMNMENISKQNAIYKIVSNYKGSTSEFVSDPDYKDKFNLTLSLSNYVREKISHQPDMINEIEDILCVFDKIVNEHKLTIDGVEKVVNTIKSKINNIQINKNIW